MMCERCDQCSDSSWNSCYSPQMSDGTRYIPLTADYMYLHENGDMCCCDSQRSDYSIEYEETDRSCTCDNSNIVIRDIKGHEARCCCDCHDETRDSRISDTYLHRRAETANPQRSQKGANENRQYDKVNSTPSHAQTEHKRTPVTPVATKKVAPARPDVLQTRPLTRNTGNNGESQQNRALRFCGRTLGRTRSPRYRNIVLPIPPTNGDIEVIAKRLIPQEPPAPKPQETRASKLKFAVERCPTPARRPRGGETPKAKAPRDATPRWKRNGTALIRL
ncbi:uncharacterized protein BXIN_1184 [Babesia sp. Xinjiang]|uniref:uncharacterized protein n=1 Tax=Babesia sp. Xinjiang TaxID=462227 RepID=UPI000A2322AB|nr:uncharacterized protein BXIN_1184 [Babesia sp. Xinjiang]ORM40030.1 hypothetical protein BXIN_1184 [Babesia sp. Xinjiang]